jgi:hypothetical protein
MQFDTTIEGIPVRVSVSHGHSLYEVRVTGVEYGDALRRSFNTIEAAEKAIAAYNLSLRKGFTNPVAYRRGGEEVRVTSICDGGHECWIVRANGEREKTSVASLYASADEVASASQREREIRDEIVRLWDNATRWAPEWPKGEGDGQG